MTPTVPRPARVLTAGLLAVAVCGAATSTALAADGFEPKDKAAVKKLREQRQASDLLNGAVRFVQLNVDGCAVKLPDSEPKATHDAPSQALLDVLAPLRRPATADDVPPNGVMPIGPFGSETFVDYVRTATTATGEKLTIVIGRRANGPLIRPSKRCLDLEHARLVKTAAHKPKRVRSLALRSFAYMRRQQEKARNAPAAAPKQEGIYLFHDGGGGGGAGLADFRKRGTFISRGGGPNDKADSRVDGLVPDGVASVTLEYPKTRDRGPLFKPAVYPSAFSVTVPVQENVLSVQVPRPPEDAFPHTMVWKDAAGTVINTFVDPNF